jgi:predicted RNA-binding Zn-ribbon protein involved in translation (DUF1610 family)
MKTWIYVCTSSSCGKTEIVTFAPSSSKKCPECGCSMIRKDN